MTTLRSFVCGGRAMFVLGIAIFGLAACGGGSQSSGNEASGAATASSPDSDLEGALASTPPALTIDQAKALIEKAVHPVATTARLKMLNDFVPRCSSDGCDYLAQAMEGVVWGTPRDFVGTPKALGGQTLATSVDLEDDAPAGPTRITVSGTASADYKLDFTVAGFHVTVDSVPAGASAEQTAKIVADAIGKSSESITATMGASFDALGGDHEEDQSGVDDLEVSTDGATVVILVAQNGG